MLCSFFIDFGGCFGVKLWVRMWNCVVFNFSIMVWLICLVLCVVFQVFFVSCMIVLFRFFSSRFLVKVFFEEIDCICWFGFIGCLLMLCVWLYRLCLKLLNVFFRLVNVYCCRLLQVMMLCVVSLFFIILLMLGIWFIGNGCRNVFICCGGIMNWLFGLCQFEVILVRNLFGVILVEVVRFVFLWICMWMVWVMLVVSLMLFFGLVMFRQVLFSDNGLIRLVWCRKILCIWCDIVL